MNIASNPKTTLIIETVLLVVALLTAFLIGSYQENANFQVLITQDSEYLSSKIDDFLQTGQIFINSYALSLDINNDIDSLVLQLRKSLLPFPFFSQLNLVDSSGKIVAGFPQNNQSQMYLGWPANQSDLLNDMTVFPRKKDSSLIVFIKNVSKTDQSSPIYLIGESDLRANPLSTELRQIISYLDQQGILVSLYDASGMRIIQFNDGQSINMDNSAYEKLDKRIALQNWVLSFTYAKDENYLKVLFLLSPLIFLVGILESFLVFSYFKKGKNGQKILNLKSGKTTSAKPDESRLESFKSHLLEISSLEEIGNLILNYSEIGEESSIRVVFFENPLAIESEKKSAYGIGKKSNDYSYLDEQIGISLGQSAEMEVPDLRGFNGIRLRQDKTYPLAIYAIPIRNGKSMNGFVWFGYDQPRVMQIPEKKYIKDVIETSKKIIFTFLRNQVYKDISVTQNMILESIPIPVLLMDKDKVILYSNEELDRTFKIEGSNHGKKIQEIFEGTLPSEAIDLEKKGTTRYERANGDIYLIHSNLIDDDNDDPKKVLIFENISSQENWKKNLSDTSAMLSHDLKVPLTTIKGYLTMLPVMGQINQQQRTYIENGIQHVDEMNNLIKSLFAQERMESKSGLILEEISVNEIVEEIIKSLQPLADQRRIFMAFDHNDSPEMLVTIDKNLMKIALNNLIENAIRFTPNQGKVTVRTGLVQNMAEIAIEDNGIGIASVDLPHIFEKFYRMKIKSSLEEEGGGGQSLSMIKVIVEKHGGEVGVVSELGRGSTFFIRLPLLAKIN